MLIQFTVENHLSLREGTTLSMIASSDSAHGSHLISHQKVGNVLRCAAIYGANAAGKSNIITAMDHARDLILSGTQPNTKISLSPFKLSTHVPQWSRFQFDFLQNGVRYSYGFKVAPHAVLEEFLCANRRGRDSMLFERTTTDSGIVEADFGHSLKRGKSSYLKYKEADTRGTQLLLTSLNEGNLAGLLPELVPVIEWFRNVLTIIPAESRYRGLEMRTHQTIALRTFLGTFLHAADTGIREVTTEETTLDWERDLPDVPIEIRESVSKVLTELSLDVDETSEPVVEFQAPNGRRYLIRRSENGALLVFRLLLQHAAENDATVSFEVNEESDGTERMINLAPMLYDLVRGRERVIIIDELDRRLHPRLSRFIVESALQCPGRNQIIFTTHDSNLLDLNLLRRDEIWFVEKDEKGGSHLYSLEEFKVRPDLQIQKGYLNGRFGAVPIVGDIARSEVSLETMEVQALANA